MTAAATSRNLVGPCVRAGDLAEAIAEAAQDDNPDCEVIVEEHGAYVRVLIEQQCLLRQQSIERHLGRPFKMWELQPDLASIAGLMDLGDDSVRFYYEKKL